MTGLSVLDGAIFATATIWGIESGKVSAACWLIVGWAALRMIATH